MGHLFKSFLACCYAFREKRLHHLQQLIFVKAFQRLKKIFNHKAAKGRKLKQQSRYNMHSIVKN
jgi:hypothetical protein